VALKPNIVILVPLALLVSGRFRVFGAFAIASAVVGLAELAVLGQSGVATWLSAIQYVQSDAGHSFFTMARLFGRGPGTYGVWADVWLVILVAGPVSRPDYPPSPLPATSDTTSRSVQPAGRPALDDRMRSRDTSSA